MAEAQILTDRTGALPELLIFDFDGVVADSEVISLSTLQGALGSYGIDMALDEVRRQFLGKSTDKIKREVRVHNPDADWDAFDGLWHGVLFARFRDELAALPGLVDLLDRIQALGLQHCIASSSGFERMGIALAAMGLTDRFDHVFSAKQVSNGKPAPDLFLLAAQTVGVLPERCLVLEDSPYGIQAASAAGMRSIGFVGGAHLSGLQAEHRATLLAQGAAGVVNHLDEVTFSRTGG